MLTHQHQTITCNLLAEPRPKRSDHLQRLIKQSCKAHCVLRSSGTWFFSPTQGLLRHIWLEQYILYGSGNTNQTQLVALFSSGSITYSLPQDQECPHKNVTVQSSQINDHPSAGHKQVWIHLEKIPIQTCTIQSQEITINKASPEQSKYELESKKLVTSPSPKD